MRQPSPGIAAASSTRQIARGAVAFDRSGLAPVAGLRAAVGLLVVLAAGTALGGPIAGVIAGSGALVIGIVSLTGGVRPPLRTMVITALAVALSIFVGSVTGRVTPVHVLVLALWAFAAGMGIALGPGATTVGLQALVAFVVYGRFGDTAAGSARLAGISLAGATFQILLTGVVRWPEALRAQRGQLAATFQELVRLARGLPETSGVPAAEAADAAAQLLAGNSVLTRDDGDALRGLLDEARRIRLALISLSGVRRRIEGGEIGVLIDAVRASVATVLDTVAGALTARDAVVVDRLHEQVDQLSGRVAALGLRDRDPSAVTGAAGDVLAALAGQLRAVAALLDEIRQTGGTSLHLPRLRLRRNRGLLTRARSELAQLDANLTARSASFRHAMRLGAVVPLAWVIGQYAPLGRGYWVALTVAVVLRPDFGSTFTLGIGRTLGTLLGAAAAGLAVAALHPSAPFSIVAIGLLAWPTFAMFGAGYAAFVAGLTAIIVLMFGLVTAGTVSTAVDRVVDTVLGGALAMIAYLLWPTWSAAEGSAALGTLLDDQRAYLCAIFDRITGRAEPGEARVSELARHARMARSNAHALVDRSLREPWRHRIDADRTAGILAALRRVSEALHLLRTQAATTPGTLPQSAALADAMATAMSTIASSLRGAAGDATLPPLRQLHAHLVAEVGETRPGRLIISETDEIVDALNTVGHLAGLEPREATMTP